MYLQCHVTAACSMIWVSYILSKLHLKPDSHVNNRHNSVSTSQKTRRFQYKCHLLMINCHVFCRPYGTLQCVGICVGQATWQLQSPCTVKGSVKGTLLMKQDNRRVQLSQCSTQNGREVQPPAVQTLLSATVHKPSVGWLSPVSTGATASGI